MSSGEVPKTPEEYFAWLNRRLRALERAKRGSASEGFTLPARLDATNYLGAGNDPNALTENGWYSGYSWIGSLAGFGIGTLLVERYGADWINQTFTTVEAVPRKYIRSRHSGTTWGAWSQVATTAIVDTKVATAVANATRGQIPSAVVVGSGSASVAADGLITFTTVGGYLALDGVFAGTPGEVYRIYIQSQGSTNNYQYIRTRNGGATVSSAGYNRVAHYTANTLGPTRSGQFGDSVMTYLYPFANATPVLTAELTWHQPNIAGKLSQVHTVSLVAASDRFLWDEYGQGSKGDGFAIIFAGGTATGTVKVVKVA